MCRVYQKWAAAVYSSLYFFIFLSLQFSNIKIFRHTFLRNYEAKKVETSYTHGQWTDVSCILESGCCSYSSLYFSFSSIFKQNFLSHFSLDLWGLEGWNFVHTWTVDGCILYTRIRLLLLIHPFIFHFSFSTIFQTLKFLVTFSSGILRPRRLKLGTHVDSGQMYRVYGNQAAAAYLFLYFFIFLSLQYSKIKIFRHNFLRNCEA